MIDRVVRTLRRLLAGFRDGELDRDLDAEIASHLEMAVDENLQRGLSPEEARRQAMLRFGAVARAKEQHRDARLLPALDTLLQDLRYAVRTCRRDRGFTVVAVLILAIGIGANIAVFSVVDTLMLKPLPFPEPQQLAWLAVRDFEDAGLSGVTYTVSAYEEFKRHNKSFQQVTCYNPFLGNSEAKLVGRGEPQPVQGLMVAGNFFQTLGVQPEHGRLFSPDEAQTGGPPVTILGHAFWQRHFGGDPAVVGQAITLNNTSFTVVGVLPPSFDFGSVFAPGVRMDVYVPAPLEEMRTWGNTLAVIGRLEPGVTIEQAQAEANVLFPQFRAAHPEWFQDYSSTIAELKDYVSGKLRRPLVVLWCAVGLIFLIVCVNLLNLMLARTAARSKELAVRSALGAGRARIVRQLTTESMVLTLAGGLLGLALGYALTFYISRQGSIALPLLSSVRVDGVGLAWAGLIAATAALLFGLVPGLRAPIDRLQEVLKDSGPGLSGGKKHARLRSVLVVSEVALACVLLVSAGLLLRSFLRVLDVDLGFEPSRAAVIRVDYEARDREQRGAVLQEMLEQVRALPGVEAAGVTDMLPLDRNRSWGLVAKGRSYDKEDDLAAFVRIVTPGYIDAMGVRLLEGRDFDWHDTDDGEQVIIINEAAARRHWPGESPVGKLAYGIGQGEYRVIGVISDVRQASLEGTIGPEVYAPVTQQDPEGAELVVRSSLPPEAIASTVASALRGRGPNQLVAEFRPAQRLVDHAVSPRRFFAFLVGAFAVFGLVLAALGIYGVISYSVVSQTKEIGIRMALGATAGRVQRGVIARTLRLALMGVALGALGSLAAAELISSLLFGTVPTDPATFSGTVLLLVAVAFVAGYIPARRASRIDPMRALAES
jgi:predicted permease